eukprot:SM000466S16657  [mRNA]  locus=s466:3388:6071:+ [translate_table: standard]
MDFGAAADAVTYDTPALQAALDCCAGCGTVLVPRGRRLLTATVFMHSHTTLHLEEGSVIYGGPHLLDYPRELEDWYVILAVNATEVSITGSGTIHGQSNLFVEKFNRVKNVMVSWNKTGACFGNECRPRLVGFRDCSYVRVTGVKLHQPAYWCLHVARCRNVHIKGISILGDFSTPYNDGIDIDGTNDTLIEFVDISTGDDAICAKTLLGPMKNLTMKHCNLRSKSSAIKLGSESHFDFQSLHFEHINITDSHRGLAIQLRDAGNITNVTFTSINMVTRYYSPLWWGRAEVIYITACPRTSTVKPGQLRGVTLSEIHAFSENGIFISGSSRNVIKDVQLKNVSIVLSRWTKHDSGLRDYRPGCQGLVNHSTSALAVEFAEKVHIKNMKIAWSKFIESEWASIMDIAPTSVSNLG